MKYSILHIAILSLFTGASSTQAQVARPKPAKPVKTAVVPTQEDLNFAKLLPSTAKVMFIDSLVANESDFLQKLPLSSSCGKISMAKSDKGEGYNYYFTNEFGNKKFSSVQQASGKHVFMVQERLGNKWDASEILHLEGVSDIICPYLMPDGVTLYFAARDGEDSMGKYDIYFTVYDSDSHSFYKPQNIGLPFNSFADDTYYIIDDFNEIGYLVTNRRQPDGKVCVYIFQPTESRETYDEATPEALLDRLARLRSIKDSQSDENVLAAAKSRLDEARMAKGAKSAKSFDFVINGQLTYHNISDFRSRVNQDQFPTYLTMKNSVETRENQLEELRTKYHNGNRNLAATIAQMEIQVFNERQKLNLTEKQIRNTEIQAISK